MYDPNQDAEERLRKLAMQELMVNNKDMTPTIPQPEIAVAPPEMPDTSMMDQMQAALANYQGMAPINPIVGDVTRGGQQIQPIGPKFVSGTGLNTSGLLADIGNDKDDDKDDDKKAKMAEMIMKMMGGG